MYHINFLLSLQQIKFIRSSLPFAYKQVPYLSLI